MKLQELRKYFDRTRLKDCEIANDIHMTRSAFCHKMKGNRAFSLEDVKAIQERFNMTDSEVVFYFIK